MEALLSRLEALPDHKDLLKLQCRRNDIKVSFLVNMTLSKSKTIYSKLIKTYNKSFINFKLRWLENELKLFHFCLLAISTLREIRIKDFTQSEWKMLQEAFPNKDLAILQYETMNFVTNKDTLKKKWESEQDKRLTEIIKESDENIKWNQIAVQLFLKSQKMYFRSSKQCRERWLNHLDDSIKHEKWSEEEDKMLVGNVIKEGKKWSQIMRCFGNQRTEHMIKNRFISLILRFKKIYPLIQDEDQLVKKMGQDMDVAQENKQEFDRQEIEKKLRPKHKVFKVQSENSEQLVQVEPELKEPAELPKIQVVPFPLTQNSPFQPHHIDESGAQKMMQSMPTPSFMSPLAFMNCNSFASNFAYFQCYMNYFPREQ